MPARIGIVNGIIITVAIEVTSIYSFVIKVLCVIGRDKSTPFRVIVSCVEVIKFGVFVVVVTTISNRVSMSYNVVCGCALNGTVTPCVICVLNNFCTACVINSNNVALLVVRPANANQTTFFNLIIGSRLIN